MIMRHTLGLLTQADHSFPQQMFNDELTDDKKKRIDLQHIARSEPCCTLAILLERTKELHRGCFTGRGRLREGLDRVLQAADNHAVVGDVFMQSQGQPATFVWGSIRLILRVVTADIEAGEELGLALIFITDQVERWECSLHLFGADKRVFDTVTRLFAHSLHYLVKATLYLSTFRPGRTVKAAFGGNFKFKKIFSLIQQCSSSLDSEFSFAAEARARQRDKLDFIVAWLEADPGFKSSTQPPKAEPGTCCWLLNDPAYNSWKQSSFQRCLWVQGITGCGKSTLAGSFAKTAGTDFVISHYFCELLGVVSALSFAVTIVVFFCKTVAMSTDPRLDGIVDILLRLHLDANARSQLDLDRMLDILDSVFAKLPETTIIVDALNECRDQNATRLYEYLNALSQRPRLRVVIFSRQDADMETIFEDAEIIKMDRSKVERDIRQYVKARIDRKPTLQDVSSQILEKVSVGCQEMFLWVEFMLDDLEQADTLNDQLEILEQTPAHLFDAFERLYLQTSRGCRAKQQRTRHQIFLLLVGAKRLLTVDEVSSLIALDVRTNSIDKGNEFKSPRGTVERLCRPFVTIAEGKVQLVHAAVKDFLLQRHMTLDESNAFLAEKCLSKLSQEKYSLLQNTAALLRKHLLPSGLVGVANVDISDDEPVPYDYAALYWQDHLVALPKPSSLILNKLADFIASNAAVTWSERLLDILGGGGVINITAEIAVLATLTDWANLLPAPTRDQVPIDKFFILAHNKIRQQLADDGQDTLLPYVPAIRLGQFFSIGGKSYAEFKKAYDYKKIVVDGFTKVLGKRSPLTLSARTTFINEYFSQQRIDEAEAELAEVVAIELEVLGKDSIEYFNTLQLFGSAQFCLTKYEDASETLQKSGDGLLRLEGSASFPYLANLLFHGYVLERQANLKEARRMFETIWTTWTPLMGKSHPLSLMVQTAVSSVYRKEGNYELAKENLLLAWASRLRLFTLDSNTTVDSGIQLALTYREMSLGTDVLELLAIVEKSNVFQTDFERTCQVGHIRAVVAFDRGYFHEPKMDLLKLIDRTTGDEREKNNRECLWIRTTLADVLRQHGDDADALMLFSELVGPTRDSSDARPMTPSLIDEPESPTQLAIAEQALRLVKAADVVGAQDLLSKNGLRWLRLKDFWNRQGGPITDTAYMKPVELAPALRKAHMGDTQAPRVPLPRPPSYRQVSEATG